MYIEYKNINFSIWHNNFTIILKLDSALDVPNNKVNPLIYAIVMQYLLKVNQGVDQHNDMPVRTAATVIH